jgi:hypothetical protein
MMIVRALSLAFLVGIFSFTLSNREMVVKYVESLHISADASEVVFENMESGSFNKNQSKPTFMQVEKINQHELPAQARIGYLLSRGF